MPPAGLTPKDAVITAGLAVLFMLPLTILLLPLIHQGTLWGVAGGVSAQTAAIAAATAIVLRRRRVPWHALGWNGNARRWILGIAGGLAIYAGIQLVGFGLASAVGQLPSTSSFIQPALADRSGRSLLIFLSIAGLLAPLGEELFFRGVLYTALRGRLGYIVAALGSATAFALLHGEWSILFLPVWLAGVALAALYQVSGSLLVPMVAHAVHNILTALVAYFMA